MKLFAGSCKDSCRYVWRLKVVWLSVRPPNIYRTFQSRLKQFWKVLYILGAVHGIGILPATTTTNPNKFTKNILKIKVFCCMIFYN